jgi:hypothetical protein
MGSDHRIEWPLLRRISSFVVVIWMFKVLIRKTKKQNNNLWTTLVSKNMSENKMALTHIAH